MGHIFELEAIGWHVIGLRPRGAEATLWRVTIERYDENASMTMIDADPDAALAALVRRSWSNSRCRPWPM